ncbi:hypothetical protein [Ulvibacterium marinum]|uniref:SIR2-like domain-containing protein n=1 Tax=Ulvibacterium marinum TaxID=2419782 RepID=A0A3B0C5F1_9FLAO|nr:hypothetical protein [Ulvibacterium marinum]RKN78526.1 hypothetical protein D7Z94_20140 [Ulvibacterium marinum]
MNKIVYLFGAGASRNALPIVDEIPDRIQELIELLKSDDLQLSNKDKYDDLTSNAPESKSHYQLELIKNLEWLLTESSNHASVDTFAKKLTIKGNRKELEKLKVALSIFFVFQQALNKPDKRYDTFFASIHNSLYRFPDNLRILSWNYDYQFELSYSEYSSQQDVSSNQSSLNVKHKYGDNDTDERFGIYKLNGTTGLYSDGGWRQYMFAPNLKVPVDLSFVDRVVRNFTAVTYFGNLYSNFSFAWERENPDKSIVDLAIKNTEDCLALVIIGYSFPFFNRDIDRKIIGAMKNLKSVYFQAPDADVLIERFKAIKDNTSEINLIPKYDTGQFVLPNEL